MKEPIWFSSFYVLEKGGWFSHGWEPRGQFSFILVPISFHNENQVPLQEPPNIQC